MKNNKKNNRISLILLAVVFSFIFVISGSALIYAAELDLRLSAQIGSAYATFYLETDDSSLIGFDGNDAEVPQNPDTLPASLYSTVGGKNLIIDSYSKASRIVNLRLVSQQNGTATISWNSVDSHFSVSVKECSTAENECVTISSGSVTQLNSGSTTKYLQVSVTYSPDAPPTPGTTTGGGGATAEKTSMKIGIPKPIALEEMGEVEFDITLENDGNTNFNDVKLSGKLSQNSQEKNTKIDFSKSSFASLPVGKKETIKVKTPIYDEEIAVYEIAITATSTSPSYTTTAKMYLTFIGKNGSGIAKIIAFTEGLIDENAECYELRGMIEDAKKDFEEGRLKEAIEKAQKALESCKKITEAPKKPLFSALRKENIMLYLGIAIIAAIAFGVVFNLYKLWRFGKLRKTKFFKSKKPDISRYKWK